MNENARMSFGDHLEELRVRLIRCLLVIVLACIVCWFFRSEIFHLIEAPIKKALIDAGVEKPTMKVTSVEGAFLLYLKLVIIAGVLVSSPVCLLQGWAFVRSGLYLRERKYAYRFAPFSIGMFALGAVLCYLYMLPVCLQFLLTFGGDQLEVLLTADKGLTFVASLMVIMGVVFETPLVMLFLSYIGVGTPAFYSHYRRHFILTAAILSALFTPQDIASMLMMAVPLVLLYELGILLVRLVGKKPAKETPAE